MQFQIKDVSLKFNSKIKNSKSVRLIKIPYEEGGTLSPVKTPTQNDPGRLYGSDPSPPPPLCKKCLYVCVPEVVAELALGGGGEVAEVAVEVAVVVFYRYMNL